MSKREAAKYPIFEGCWVTEETHRKLLAKALKARRPHCSYIREIIEDAVA